MDKQITRRDSLSLSQISHELRTPVTLINSYLQLFCSSHPEVKTFPYWKDIMENMELLKELLEPSPSITAQSSSSGSPWPWISWPHLCSSPWSRSSGSAGYRYTPASRNPFLPWRATPSNSARSSSTC